MTKTEAIAILEARGWRITNKRKAVVTAESEIAVYQFTTEKLKELASQPPVVTEPKPIHKQEPNTTTTVPVLERDTQAIADAIEKACRIVVMVAVACYVAGYTLGTWVHTVNAWLVALHKRTCKERVEIVLGYIVDGIVSTKEMVEAWA